MNQITNKNYCVVLRGNYKTYLTKEEAEFLGKAFESGKEVVRIGDKTFFKFSVLFILPAGEIEREDKIKRGEWQCQICCRWHAKFEECGCREEKKYNYL